MICRLCGGGSWGGSLFSSTPVVICHVFWPSVLFFAVSFFFFGGFVYFFLPPWRCKLNVDPFRTGFTFRRTKKMKNLVKSLTITYVRTYFLGLQCGSNRVNTWNVLLVRTRYQYFPEMYCAWPRIIQTPRPFFMRGRFHAAVDDGGHVNQGSLTPATCSVSAL